MAKSSERIRESGVYSDLHTVLENRVVMKSRKDDGPYDVEIVKFAGELDLCCAIFRGVRVEATILRHKDCENKFDLPAGEIEAELEITKIAILNSREGKYVFEGGASLLVDGGWGGKHFYHFEFIINMKSRTGLGKFR